MAEWFSERVALPVTHTLVSGAMSPVTLLAHISRRMFPQ
jgi:hypothetical protein